LRVEAQEHLDFALGEFRDMKMQPSLERALGDRETLEARPAKAPAYPGGLSEREVEVLRLLARGKTNREIANELVLSDRVHWPEEARCHSRDSRSKSRNDSVSHWRARGLSAASEEGFGLFVSGEY